MTKRTANIIGICKGISCKYDSDSIKRNIAMYIADECLMSVDYYSNEQIDLIIVQAFLDFIDEADKPSVYLKDVLYTDTDTTIPDSIINIFSTLIVKKGTKYINGFSKKLIDQMNNDIELDITN